MFEIALMLGLLASEIQLGIIRPNLVKPPVYYFACFAQAEGLESDPSNEVCWTNALRRRTVTLAWDASTSPEVTNYTMKWGRQSQTWTNSVSAGTNLQCTVELWPPPKTNLLLSVWARSNLMASLSISGPWHPTNNPLTLTNPTGKQFFRGYGVSNYVFRF